MAPLSQSQYAARLAEHEIELEKLLGHPLEEQVRAELLRRLRSGEADRDSDEVVLLVQMVEGLALWRLGLVAEQPPAPGRDWLYVLSFAGARPYVKVGRTGGFAVRQRDHRRDAERDGYVLFDAWASEPVGDAHPWEQAVLRELRRRHPGESIGEYFYDLDYDEAIEVVHQQRIRVTPRSVALPVPQQQPA